MEAVEDLAVQHEDDAVPFPRQNIAVPAGQIAQPLLHGLLLRRIPLEIGAGQHLLHRVVLNIDKRAVPQQQIRQPGAQPAVGGGDLHGNFPPGGRLVQITGLVLIFPDEADALDAVGIQGRAVQVVLEGGLQRPGVLLGAQTGQGGQIAGGFFPAQEVRRAAEIRQLLFQAGGQVFLHQIPLFRRRFQQGGVQQKQPGQPNGQAAHRQGRQGDGHPFFSMRHSEPPCRR